MKNNLTFILIILFVILFFDCSAQTKKELRQIIKTEDTTKLKIFIDNGFDVNSMYSKNTCFLNQAILHEKLTLTKFILRQENVQIQRTGKGSFTTLHYVVFNGWYSLAKNLIKRGVDPNASIEEFHILSIVMINYGWEATPDAESLDFIKYLYANGLNLDLTRYCCSGKTTPLIMSTHSADLLTIEYLINQHKSINIVDIDGQTALHLAVKNDRIDVVQLLLENGAKLNIKDKKGRTPLDYAVKQDNEEMIQLLESLMNE